MIQMRLRQLSPGSTLIRPSPSAYAKSQYLRYGGICNYTSSACSGMELLKTPVALLGKMNKAAALPAWAMQVPLAQLPSPKYLQTVFTRRNALTSHPQPAFGSHCTLSLRTYQPLEHNSVAMGQEDSSESLPHRHVPAWYGVMISLFIAWWPRS